LGGFGVAGTNTFFERKIYLPPHKKITIKFTAWAIDSWDSEYFIVTADHKEIIKEQFNFRLGNELCGSAVFKDTFVDLKTTFCHTGRFLVLHFTSNLNSVHKDESFGLNNLDILFCDSGDECIDEKNYGGNGIRDFQI